MRSLLASVTAFCLIFAGNAASSVNARIPAASSELERLIPDLLRKSDTPGMSIALIRNGKTSWTGHFGVTNSETGGAVTSNTIFEAASLTKPVVAYAALKLVDAGKLDLDTPLNKYLGNNYDVGDDPRLSLITARRVLSHTSGFPNWRKRDSKVLPINFEPGEKFSYSGEGFVYLGKVIERITGMALERYVAESVFIPLGMDRSSLEWKAGFLKTKTFNHDSLGKPRGQNADQEVNAAASLLTSAADYAKFVIALTKGTGLKKSTSKMMFEPQSYPDKDKYPALAWGLGVGLEIGRGRRCLWHWGDNGFNRSFAIADIDTGNGVVFFTNGANGLSFLREILGASIGGTHPSEQWLGYGRYDSPPRRLFKAIVAGGAEKALEEFRSKRKADPGLAITERQMNSLGYDLLRIGRKGDAVLVFRQNADDFPESANAWDSLAEGYLNVGNKEKAIEYYRNSLRLDPSNKNAGDKIRELTEEP